MRHLSNDPMSGLCYVMSEAMYHLFGKRHGFKPHVLRYRKGKTHWWLQNEQGQVIDLTASQFDSPFSYCKGRGCGFLTLQPSKRTKVLIEIVQK